MSNSWRPTLSALAFLFLLCISMAYAQENENKDDIADRIVRETELWPSKIELPESVESKELIYARHGNINLDLTYFTRKQTPDSRSLRSNQFCVDFIDTHLLCFRKNTCSPAVPEK
jgi:hypothetical protein